MVGGPFASISCGEQHTCALKPGGAARCWGLGRAGQLGTGARVSVTTPAVVVGSHLYTAIAAGSDFTCALDASNQTAWCWGQGTRGQLGNNHTECHTVSVGCDNPSACWSYDTCDGVVEAAPVAVSGTQRFASISAGSEHACALAPPGPGGGGVAWCWGDGSGYPDSRYGLVAVPFKIPRQPAGVKTIAAGNDGLTYALMAEDEGGAIYSLAVALWAGSSVPGQEADAVAVVGMCPSSVGCL